MAPRAGCHPGYTSNRIENRRRRWHGCRWQNEGARNRKVSIDRAFRSLRLWSSHGLNSDCGSSSAIPFLWGRFDWFYCKDRTAHDRRRYKWEQQAGSSFPAMPAFVSLLPCHAATWSLLPFRQFPPDGFHSRQEQRACWIGGLHLE